MEKYSSWDPSELFELLDNPIADIHSLLEVDAMYFKSAFVNYEIATKQKTQVDSALQELKEHKDVSLLEAYNWGDDIDVFDGSEIPEYIEAIELLEEAYSSSLQSLASVHIFCAFCLEAHINNYASELLSGKIRDEFDRFSIEAKWLTLPVLLGKDPYDVGGEPYQGFSRLIKFRNGLVHFKSSPDKWQRSIQPGEKISFGLSMKDAQASLNATRGMLIQLANLLNVEEPLWLNNEKSRFFKITINKKNS